MNYKTGNVDIYGGLKNCSRELKMINLNGF